MCGDVRDDSGLAGQRTRHAVRLHAGLWPLPMGLAARERGHRPSLTSPRTQAQRLLDRLARSGILWPSRLEVVEYVPRAQEGSPGSEQLVVGIGEGPTAADRHEDAGLVPLERIMIGLLCMHPPHPRTVAA